MTIYVGRPIGLWGILTVISGAAVLIPSGVALVVSLVAVAAAFL